MVAGLAQLRKSSLSGYVNHRVSSQNLRSAQHFQLDQCLSAKDMDKILYSLRTVAQARESKHLSSVEGAIS